jgi:hypothetical protein
VGFKRFVVSKCDLDAGHVWIIVDQLVNPAEIDFVVHAMCAKQDDAVTGAPVRVLEAPDSLAVERDHSVDPAFAIEIRPLIGEPQMAFDHLAADRLKVDDAGVTFQFLAEPSTAIGLDLRPGLGMNCPVVEHAAVERLARSMPPPNRFSIDHGDIGTQVLTA